MIDRWEGKCTVTGSVECTSVRWEGECTGSVLEGGLEIECAGWELRVECTDGKRICRWVVLPPLRPTRPHLYSAFTWRRI